MPTAGTVTQSATLFGHVRRLTFTCTASVDAATFPATVVTTKIEGRLLKLVTNPGAVAPQAGYDVTLVDQHGRDVLESVGLNRSATDTEEVPIVYSGTAVHPVIDESDTLTLTLTGNNVNSAVTVIDLYFGLGA